MPASDPADPELARYSRQVLYERIGIDGQRQLKHAAVTLIGCGGLGSVLANTLARAGVGYLHIIDRDFIELSNLQRQVLFDERDIAENLPKAEAAARKLRRVNSAIEIEGVVADFNPRNAESLCAEADLLLDGTDNLETRFLINDVAVKHDIPWVYGGCIAAEGLVLPVLPGKTPCIRCLWDTPPSPGQIPTCDTVGVLAMAVNVVASLQATAAIKILTGHTDELGPGLTTVDVWSGRMHSVDVQAAFDAGDCRCCKQRRFDFLSSEMFSAATTLCGHDAVQILPAEGCQVDLKAIARRLEPRMRPKYNEFMLRFKTDDHGITLFSDGRAIIQGTTDPPTARAVYAKYVGS